MKNNVVRKIVKSYFDKKIEFQKQQYSLESKNLEHKHKLEAIETIVFSIRNWIGCCC
jgi:hypothetical protein